MGLNMLTFTVITPGCFPDREALNRSLEEELLKNQNVTEAQYVMINIFEFKNKADYDSYSGKVCTTFNFADENCETEEDQEELNLLSDFFYNVLKETSVVKRDESYYDEYGRVNASDYETSCEGYRFNVAFAEDTDVELFMNDFVENTPFIDHYHGDLELPSPLKIKPIVTNEGDYFLLKWDID